MERKYINWVLTILIIIFTLIIVYQLVLKILGHSPTNFTIIYSIIGLMATNIFATYRKLIDISYKLGRQEGKLDGVTEQVSTLTLNFQQKRGQDETQT